MSKIIVFDLDGVITSEEAYWITAGLVVHELLFSPRYWNIATAVRRGASPIGTDFGAQDLADGGAGDRKALADPGTGDRKGGLGLPQSGDGVNPSSTLRLADSLSESKYLDGDEGLGLSPDRDQPYPPFLELAPQEYERVAYATFPKTVILKLKARSINSNWDTCYVAACICLIELLARLGEEQVRSLQPLRPWEQEWVAAFRQALAQVPGPIEITTAAFGRLDDPFFVGITGLELIDRLNVYAGHVLNVPVEGVFARYSPSWRLCQDLFQQWYLGDELYVPIVETGQEQDPPVHTSAHMAIGKRGIIHLERPLLPVETLRATLEAVRERGYKLGIATGRQSQEALPPLQNYGLLEYFDESHITTHTQIARAEAALQAQGEKITLVKPHPYQFVLAADPHYQLNQPLPPPGSFIIVGDTPSDVQGGRAANAITVAVLTGARTADARMMLERSQPDFLIPDITHVPALLDQIDDMGTIQRLQFTRRELAERLLQRWFALHMDLCVEQVTLMPKAVSLNSFNGIYHTNGEEYFFKTHVEDKGILEEYYHAEMLFNAGYNVVKPLRTLHEKGQQMVIYPVVHDPVMFDLARAVETGNTTLANLDLLIAAEQRECERLLTIYEATLKLSSAEEHARAPIHQLFWHRLTGERLTNFYAGKRIPFPENAHRRGTPSGSSNACTFEELLGYRWVINGVKIATWKATLGELLEQARTTLHPAREMYTVIGHGDAHFGNVFLEDQKHYKYFDPAFAGRHSPLLDIVKPFFHNVFAMWMYFPDEIARQLQVTVDISDNTIFVEHNYVLSPIRQVIWETKVEYLLKPLLTLLRKHNALPPDWLDIWRLAMLCCPLLTVNLLDVERRPASICWLGLSQVMQMGNLENI